MAPDRRSLRNRFSFALVAFILVALGACATLPPLNPPIPGAHVTPPFPQGRWQLVHRIEARFPGNHKALMMGALELDSANHTLTCALMTVEGFTLFSAAFSPGDPEPLQVTRAVAPFDGPGFAQGLMDDLRLLFFAPQAARLEMGSSDHKPVWRYTHRDGAITDVVTRSPDQFRLALYTAAAECRRSAELTMKVSPDPMQGIARHIQLDAHGDAAYTLRMDLIDAVPLENTDHNPPKDVP
jgi:hypothetical protein